MAGRSGLDPRAAAPIAIVAFLISALAAFLVSSGQSPTYEARTTLSEDTSGTIGAPAPEDETAIRGRLELYARVAATDSILASAIERLEADVSVDSLARRLDAEVSEDGNALILTVEDEEAGQAAALVNAVAQELTAVATEQAGASRSLAAQTDSWLLQRIDWLSRQEQRVERLQGLDALNRNQQRRLRRLSRYVESAPGYFIELVPFSTARSSGQLAIFDPAITPTEPVEPQPLVDGLLGGLMGVFLVLPLVFVPHFLDEVIHDAEDLREDGGLLTMGVVRRIRGDWLRPALGYRAMLLAPDSAAADAYRSLALGFELASTGRHGRVLLVAAPRRAEAKSSTATNLAIALAQRGRRVVLIDADLDRPRVHEMLGVANGDGLADLLASDLRDPAELLRPTEQPGLLVLTAGDVRRHRLGHIGSATMRRLLGRLKANSEVVVVDAPPLRDSAAGELLGSVADSVILALTAGRSRRAEVGDAVRSLARARARLIGAVIVQSRPWWLPRLPDARRPRGGILRHGATGAPSWQVPRMASRVDAGPARLGRPPEASARPAEEQRGASPRGPYYIPEGPAEGSTSPWARHSDAARARHER